MKLTVSIPVEKVHVPAGYTFRGAIVEAEGLCASCAARRGTTRAITHGA